jgi:hypothetical protein
LPVEFGNYIALLRERTRLRDLLKYKPKIAAASSSTTASAASTASAPATARISSRESS